MGLNYIDHDKLAGQCRHSGHNLLIGFPHWIILLNDQRNWDANLKSDQCQHFESKTSSVHCSQVQWLGVNFFPLPSFIAILLESQVGHGLDVGPEVLVLWPHWRGVVGAGLTLLRQVGLVGGRWGPRAAEDGLELPRLSLNPLHVLWICLLRYNKQEEHNIFPAWWLLLNH